jgi:hypothetical protein
MPAAGMRMPGPRVRVSAAALVAANLVPLAAVALGWWSTYEVMLLFWAENVVIGLGQLLRFGTLAVLRGMAAALGVGLFFAAHYGLFTLVHGAFVLSLFAPEEGWDAAAGLLFSADGLLFGLLALGASHLVSFAVNFLGGGEYRQATPDALMTEPYGRVVVLHLAILFGGFAMTVLGAPAAMLIVLVLLKIGFDLRAHLAAHRSVPDAS